MNLYFDNGGKNNQLNIPGSYLYFDLIDEENNKLFQSLGFSSGQGINWYFYQGSNNNNAIGNNQEGQKTLILCMYDT